MLYGLSGAELVALYIGAILVLAVVIFLVILAVRAATRSKK